MSKPGNLYVLQEPQHASLSDALVAERSGEDLLLAFRSQEQARPALKFEQFFSHDARLHVLKHDGELLRAVMGQDDLQQGPVAFDLQAASATEQQVVSPVLGLLLPSAEIAPAAELEPQTGGTAAPVQLAALNVAPLSAEPPQITQAIDQIGARQGSLASGSVTDDRYATIEGTGTPGSYLEILDNGEVIGEVQVGSDGRWRFEPDQAFGEAGHVLTARVQGSGESSASFVLVVDTIAPSRAIIDSISDDRAGSQVIDRNGHTSDNTPVIKGRAEPFSVVALYSGKTLIGTSFTDAAGNWEFSSIFIMPDGEYTISATALDFSGNAGLSSTSYKITIDTLPPAVPTIDQVIDDVGPVQGALQSGAVTDDSRPTFSGHAEAGTVVTIYDNGYKLGDVRADANGNWSFTPENALANGGHSFTVRAQDAAGNQSGLSPSWDLVLDNNMPEKPGSEGSSTQISEAIDDHGPVQGPIAPGDATDDRTPTFNGTGEPGDTIIILDKGEKIGEVVVDDQGKWTFTPETELGDGEHAISVIIRNQAGNESEPSDALEFTVDTQAPEAPSIGGVYDDVGAVTGELVSGAATDDTQPTLSGQAEAGAIVSIFDGEQKLGEVQADENGNWSFTPATELNDGPHHFTTVAQDAAGNQSAPSDSWIIIVDTAAPTASAVVESMSKDSGADSGDFITNDGSAGRLIQGSLTATLDAGEKVQISTDSGATWLDVLLGSNNTWSFLDKNNHTGDWTIQTRVVDLAGNANVVSQSISLDNVAPDAPDAFAINGTTVTVTFDGSSLVAGDTILVTVGSERFEQVLTQAQIDAGMVDVITTPGVRMDNTSAAFLDRAGNASPILSFHAQIVDFERETPSAKNTNDSVDFGIFTFTWNDASNPTSYYPRGIVAAGTQLGDGYKTSSVGLGMWGGPNRVTLNDGETASSVTFIYADAIRAGSVNFYDASGKLIHSESLEPCRGTSKVVNATMPAGLKFSYFEIVPPNGEQIWVDQFEFGGTSSGGFVTNDPATTQSIDGTGTYHGGDTDNVFSVSDVAYLDAASSVISGGAGIDTLSLTGTGQVLDLGGIAGKLESIEIFDITGTGNNTLKLSLGDLLENGGKNLFLADDNIQLMVKGDAGDKVVLDDLLPNGADPGDWAAAGTVTVAGVVYETYQHSALNAELLVQQGVTVDLV